MLKAETPDRFRVDFAQVKRRGSWWKMFEQKANAVVDGWAIGQAVVGVLSTCPFKSATGQPQVWNEYRVFLSRADHDRLRPIEASLQQDLGPILYEELMRIGAVTVGALTVRLLVDDADEVGAGTGMIHARHVPDAAATPAAAGEITVRLDKIKAAAPTRSAGGAGTLPVGAAVLHAPAGELVLRGNVRYVLGRAHPDAEGDHLAIPGATGRVNRRQLSLLIDGDQVEVGREAGESNPVAVGGNALAPGQVVREKMPIELTLSGELKLSVRRA